MGQSFGVIGLAVMGENIARNIERNGFSVSVFNRSYGKTQRFLDAYSQDGNFVGSKDLSEFVASLEMPRRILLMVKSGTPVDSVISQLRPLLSAGDIIIDGGNSHFGDTERRAKELEGTGLRFFGMGISGGEEGALWGPSMMPGGDRESYEKLSPVLEKVAAKANGEACVTYVGERSAGHFVKMVHNGIEYGDMQLIAEAYDLMRFGLRMEPKEIAETFTEWNKGVLQSYLVEITSKIIDFSDDLEDSGVLIDKILDAAGQKGTGKWTSIAALDLGIPVPTITAAVDARIMSAHKKLRQSIAKDHPHPSAFFNADRNDMLQAIHGALYASKICAYAQGFHLMMEASKEYGYQLELDRVAQIWKAGCIIRADLLNAIQKSFTEQPDREHMLLDPQFFQLISAHVTPWRQAIQLGLARYIALPAMSASLAYFESMRRERLPANIIQAQRDFFGAHTYKRTDREGTFHTSWPSLTEK